MCNLRFICLSVVTFMLAACMSGPSHNVADPAFRDSVLVANNTISHIQQDASFEQLRYAFSTDEEECEAVAKVSFSEFCKSVRKMPLKERRFMKNCYGDFADLAVMSQYAYKDSDVQLPEGWTDMNIEHPSFGLKCSLLAKEDRYVLAFAGTDFPADWKDPVQIVDFLVDAYEDVDGAVNNDASQIRQAYGIIGYILNDLSIDIDKLEFTGHSLGGRIAAEMAVEYGCPAVSFNAAGVAPDVYDAYLHLRENPVSDRSGYIINITSANDQLTCLQKYMSGSSDPYLTSLLEILTDDDNRKDEAISFTKKALGGLVDYISSKSDIVGKIFSKVDEYYNRDYKALGASLIVSENMEGHGIEPLAEALRRRAESI